LWELDGTLLKTIPNPSELNRLAISFDGKIIATGAADTNVNLWSIILENYLPLYPVINRWFLVWLLALMVTSLFLGDKKAM
jgi:WD40 repeat protein